MSGAHYPPVLPKPQQRTKLGRKAERHFGRLAAASVCINDCFYFFVRLGHPSFREQWNQPQARSKESHWRVEVQTSLLEKQWQVPSNVQWNYRRLGRQT